MAGALGGPQDEVIVGLDLLEFTLAVEEALQIAIPDEDAERILTPRQVIDYVLARAGEVETTVYLEQRAFYRLRQATMRVFQVPRRSVSPKTPWRELLPQSDHRRNWRLLHEATGRARWPRVEKTVAQLTEDQFGLKSFGWDQEFVRDLNLSWRSLPPDHRLKPTTG